MENDCIECGAPCVYDLCEECIALEQLDFEREADDPPDDWYDDWNSYAMEYE